MVNTDPAILWRFTADNQTQWFHVYRSKTADFSDATQVTVQFIPAQVIGSHIYQHVDKTVTESGRYFYWVEQVSRGNEPVITGPAEISVTGKLTPFYLPLIEIP